MGESSTGGREHIESLGLLLPVVGRSLERSREIGSDWTTSVEQLVLDLLAEMKGREVEQRIQKNVPRLVPLYTMEQLAKMKDPAAGE